MKDQKQMQADLERLLKQARETCLVAEREERDLNAVERTAVAKQLEEARALKEQLKQVKDGADLIAGIAAMDPWGPPAAVKRAGGAHPWAKSLFAARGVMPFGKQLLTPSGSVGVPSLSSTIPVVGERLETVLQVVPTTTLENSAVEYLREVTRTHAAAAVAEGEAKPESVYTLEEVVAPARVIAHLSEPAPRTWFADAPTLERYLGTVMNVGLKLALEDNVLNGSGIAPELEGMLTVSGHLLQMAGADLLATCRAAITALELQSLPTEQFAFVLHPSTWEEMELMETIDSGAYKMNDGAGRAPINRQLRQLWSVPVALSTQIEEGLGLLFHKPSVELFERQQVTLDWSENVYDSESGKTDFERNLLRWRCEGRWALAIYRPSAIVEIDLGAGIGS